MLIGMVSAKASPGVTTSALALASVWPRSALVVEADPFGGDVRAGLAAGQWPPSSGLVEAVADLRSVSLDEALARRVHRPAAWAPPVLAGLGCVGQAATLPWGRLGADLGRVRDADVITDCGRYLPSDGVLGLLRECWLVVLVCGSSLRAVRSAARVGSLLSRDLGCPPGDPRLSLLVVAPDDPYGSAEVAGACGLPLLGELPDDPRAAGVWSDGGASWRGFGRSPLQRSARRLAERITGTDDPDAVRPRGEDRPRDDGRGESRSRDDGSSTGSGTTPPVARRGRGAA
ncbi:MAG: hypothetical protein NTW05_03650 [Pseudonocardiales bacterium]|nr:hypothetical protein [Pseudonocardiales bacterium]